MTFVSFHLFWFLAIFGCYRIVTNQNRRGKRGWKIVFEMGPWTQPTNKRLKSAWLSICLELIFLFIYYFHLFWNLIYSKIFNFRQNFESKVIFGKFFKYRKKLDFWDVKGWQIEVDVKILRKTWNRMLSISI